MVVPYTGDQLPPRSRRRDSAFELEAPGLKKEKRLPPVLCSVVQSLVVSAASSLPGHESAIGITERGAQDVWVHGWMDIKIETNSVQQQYV